MFLQSRAAQCTHAVAGGSCCPSSTVWSADWALKLRVENSLRDDFGRKTSAKGDGVWDRWYLQRKVSGDDSSRASFWKWWVSKRKKERQTQFTLPSWSEASYQKTFFSVLLGPLSQLLNKEWGGFKTFAWQHSLECHYFSLVSTEE